jgi:hypothetical protein
VPFSFCPDCCQPNRGFVRYKRNNTAPKDRKKDEMPYRIPLLAWTWHVTTVLDLGFVVLVNEASMDLRLGRQPAL